MLSILDSWAAGAIIGTMIAAPVGPMSTLCIQRTLSSGATFGILTGLGAATAHALYGALAVFGLGAIVMHGMSSGANAFLVLGGVALMALGIRLGRANARPASPAGARADSLVGAYASAVALAIVNPMTILFFLAALPAITKPELLSPVIVVGIASGSVLWWLGLTIVVSHLKQKLSKRTIGIFNDLCAVGLVMFGGISAGKGLAATLM